MKMVALIQPTYGVQPNALYYKCCIQKLMNKTTNFRINPNNAEEEIIHITAGNKVIESKYKMQRSAMSDVNSLKKTIK